MPDIFLSYSRDDSVFMRTLLNNLRRLGFNVWIDEEHLVVGTPAWETAIEEAVKRVDALVVIMTPASKASKWVNIELRLAELHGTSVFPILAAGDERTAIPPRLLGMQYADMRGRSDYEGGFRQLVNGVASDLDLTVAAFDMDFSGEPQVQVNVYGQNEGTIVAVGRDVAGDLKVAAGDIVQLPEAGVAEAPPRGGIKPLWIGGGLAAVAILAGILALAGVFGGGATAVEVAEARVASNVEWAPYAPYTQEFNGVEMALVPAGCFMMGSTEEEVDIAFQLCVDALGADECGRSSFDDEQPPHEQCFPAFWIDVYEVTNAQYGSEGAFSGADRPRETVTWAEAFDYCEKREARLPTEAEWEYAARGPDGLIFPWGNNFVPDNVVYVQNAGGETADVGSKPEGASWVGAMDMSGNVYEWVDSIFEPYPYDGEDDTDTDGSGDDNSERVVRGGSFGGIADNQRAANRNVRDPDSTHNNVGFRCARDY